MESCLMGTVSAFQDEESSGDWLYNPNMTVHLKTVKMVNSMLCVFYHNFLKAQGRIFTVFILPLMGHTSVNEQLKAGHTAHPPPRTEENPVGRKAALPQMGGAFRNKLPGQV